MVIFWGLIIVLFVILVIGASAVIRKEGTLLSYLQIVIGVLGIIVTLLFGSGKINGSESTPQYPSSGTEETNNQREMEHSESEKSINIETITVEPNNISLELGEEEHLKTIINGSNVEFVEKKWKSSNSNTVSVDQDGNIHAHSIGEAIIVCEAQDKEASCIVNVIGGPKETENNSNTISSDGTAQYDSQLGDDLVMKTDEDITQNTIDINGVLNTDGIWLRTPNEEIISENEALYYKINLYEPGRLDININSFADGLRWSLNDEYLHRQFFDYNIWDGKDNEPKSESQSHYLEKGIYYLKVASASSIETGKKFWLMASFMPANNRETEPNNVSEQAQDLTVGGEIRGLLSEQDDDDYYSVDINSPVSLKILIQSFMEGVTIRLLNNDLEDIDLGGNNIWDGSLEQAKVVSFTKELQPGHYFIHVTKLQDMGVYSIKLSLE